MKQRDTDQLWLEVGCRTPLERKRYCLKVSESYPDSHPQKRVIEDYARGIR
jgi:hypothetical protein